jgi:hypothetical protein
VPDDRGTAQAGPLCSYRLLRGAARFVGGTGRGRACGQLGPECFGSSRGHGESFGKCGDPLICIALHVCDLVSVCREQTFSFGSGVIACPLYVVNRSRTDALLVLGGLSG